VARGEDFSKLNAKPEMKNASTMRSQWEISPTRRFLHRLLSWRIQRRLLLLLGAAVTLTALFYAEETWRGRRAWLAHRQELTRQGVAVDLALLAPGEVPKHSNLAEAPFFRPLFERVLTAEGLTWKDSEGRKRLHSFVAPARQARGHPPECAFGSVEYDCWTGFDACLRFYLNRDPETPELEGETDAARLLAYMQKYDAAFQELAQAAWEHPACRFPVDYTHEIPFAVLLPHLSPLRGITDVLSLRAITRLELRQVEEAFADLELGLRLSQGVADEPTLPSLMVRLGTLSRNLQVIREGIARQAWTEAHLKTIERRLGRINLLSEGKRALRGERAMGVQIVDFLRRHGWCDPSELGYITGLSDPALVWLRLVPDGWFYRNMLNLSQFHEQYTMAAIEVRTGRVDPTIVEELAPALNKLPWRPSTVFVKSLISDLTHITRRIAQTQAYVDAAKMACALERYRLAGQSTPVSLESLTPTFLPEIPLDVMDGQPLRYQPAKDGAYTLYSVGWNQKDDGGVRGWSGEGPKATLDSTKGDWVWSVGK
jgi:hypothetical protein